MVGAAAYDVGVTIERDIVPRGRHAPPLAVRLDVQRRRLFAAAAAVFARSGYADASAEGISREAGMSKATFYEHFANKEECLLAMFDTGVEEVMGEMTGSRSSRSSLPSSPRRCRATSSTVAPTTA